MSLYDYIPRKKEKKIQLLFVANPRKEKGFNYLVTTFNSLDTSKYHLHIVGNWQTELRKIKRDNYTYYGAVSPNQLREIYHRAHIIINPSFQGEISNNYLLYKLLAMANRKRIFAKLPLLPIRLSYERYPTLDGFPTTCAVDAMSTGCCLISTNSRHDYFAL
jgi:glycosyltransferase involved in cell wall biosynthesis